jgi:hypothetical protein
MKVPGVALNPEHGLIKEAFATLLRSALVKISAVSKQGIFFVLLARYGQLLKLLN